MLTRNVAARSRLDRPTPAAWDTAITIGTISVADAVLE
jgi:hypothetical protein